MPDPHGTLVDELCVEVVHAEETRQIARTYRLAAPATVGTALACAAFAGDFPSVDLDRASVGIWGVLVGLEHPLQSGDRIEIYRPLEVEPKAARRQRAARPPNKFGRS
jgi:putative ubiquitin-RnfH superfamily antitoxin RatB of RatAB toxin-antitoxin module